MRTHKPVGEGEYLYLAGSRPRYVYVVSHGSLVSHCHQAEGEEQVVALHLPGDIIGLNSIGVERHAFSVRALEKSNLCTVALDDLTAAAMTIPTLSANMMAQSSHQIRETQQLHVLLSRRSAVERVARFLAYYRARLDRMGLVSNEFVLSLSRRDLANYLGLKIETVSRCFSALRDQGILRVSRRMISILDAEALGVQASGEAADLRARVA